MVKYINIFAGVSYLLVPLFLYWTSDDGVFPQMWAEKPGAMILLGLLGWAFVGLFHMVFLALTYLDKDWNDND